MEWIILLAIALMIVGFAAQSIGLGLVSGTVALLLSLQVLGVETLSSLRLRLTRRQRTFTVAFMGAAVASIGLLQARPVAQRLHIWFQQLDWEKFGILGSLLGGLGQILIAILAVYVTWRQYIISKELTIQQNTITQQQTIDSYFQGIAELMLDEDGLLEDFPMERAIAEGRTAAIISSIDASGKAKVIRFLSRAGLLTPLKRDRRLGRAIMDGNGGYAEDREAGLRVIDLGVMLAGVDLSGTDLRWTELSDLNLIQANLSRCDLVKANLARTILSRVKLVEADLMGVRLFYGSAKTATPRNRADIPDYTTGKFTGAVVEDADFSSAKRLSEEQRYYCCAWGGSKTRNTIPGGCKGIPDRLEQYSSPKDRKLSRVEN